MDRRMARDRPSPYGEGGRSAKQPSGYRSAGPVPRERCERGRFSPNKPSGYRSAGACPPRAFRRRDRPVSMQAMSRNHFDNNELCPPQFIRINCIVGKMHHLSLYLHFVKLPIRAQMEYRLY